MRFPLSPAGLRLVLAASVAWTAAACAPGESPVSDAAPVAPAASEASEPLVVAELFTSEGCSSCPPADRLLRSLADEAEAGAPILALSYHVDYWDRLGWADPFGSPAWTARQRAYAASLDGRVYTPQLVVGGDVGVVGSRSLLVRAALAVGGREAYPATLALRPVPEGRAVRVAYAVEGAPDGARLHLLLVQRAAASDVRRGENQGRRLDHANVVRAAETREAGEGTAVLALPDGLDAADVFVAALVQPDRVGPILGAARAELDAGR